MTSKRSQRISVKSSLDLYFDHSVVIFTVNKKFIQKDKPCTLYNIKTNWLFFQHLNENLNTNIPLKTSEDVTHAVEHLNLIVQQAAWIATPVSRGLDTGNTFTLTCTPEIKYKIKEKRKL